ncbi:hypothetical protein SAMN05421764_1063 [Donghicola eburneus]|nr:hypothetical protein SAMN05421764_1063 [Donghicola eburneus]
MASDAAVHTVRPDIRYKRDIRAHFRVILRRRAGTAPLPMMMLVINIANTVSATAPSALNCKPEKATNIVSPSFRHESVLCRLADGQSHRANVTMICSSMLAEIVK